MTALRAVRVFGDEREVAREAAQRAGLPLCDATPELVVCHGGDGTLLRAERVWPGVPKVPVRVGARMQACRLHTLDAVLERLRGDALTVTLVPKARLSLGGLRILAMNDVVMHSTRPTSAVRFRVVAPGCDDEEITGDGLVVATAFGSTGYYRSVARERFERGLGVAFLNTTVERAPLRLDEPARVEVIVTRGPGRVAWDNDERMPVVREGHRFSVETTQESARVVGLDALSCGDCRRADGSRFNPH